MKYAVMGSPPEGRCRKTGGRRCAIMHSPSRAIRFAPTESGSIRLLLTHPDRVKPVVGGGRWSSTFRLSGEQPRLKPELQQDAPTPAHGFSPGQSDVIQVHPTEPAAGWLLRSCEMGRTCVPTCFCETKPNDENSNPLTGREL